MFFNEAVVFFFKQDRNYEMGHTSNLSYLMAYTLTQALSQAMNTVDVAAANVGRILTYVYTCI
jgi:hypothetical protein